MGHRSMQGVRQAHSRHHVHRPDGRHEGRVGSRVRSPYVKESGILFKLLVTYSNSVCVISSRAGADVVGVNCYFDPDTSLETLALMKEGLVGAGLLEKPTYLMAQPLGWHCPGNICNRYSDKFFY